MTDSNLTTASTASRTIVKVSSGRHRRQFFELEKRLYRDDHNWVCPLWSQKKPLCGFGKHPFYLQADHQAFLAFDGQRPVGRIVAIANHAHNRHYKDKVGFFGFFECEDDPRAAAMLFDAAASWLKERGLESLRGPINPSLNYEGGLLIDGFDTPPTFLIAYNHAYYQNLFEAAQLEHCQDLFCYDASVDDLDTLDPKLQFIIDEAKRRFKVECRPLNTKRFNEDIKIFLDIYNRSLHATWGYVPMSDAELRQMASGLKMLLVPELTSIAEIEGRPVGVGFGLLDFNQVLKTMNGRLLPFGWMKLMRGKKNIDRLRLVSTNVLPEYQSWGLGLVTLNYILPAALEYGIQIGEFSWVLESNRLSRGTIERGGAKKRKTLRIFERPIT